MQGRNILPYLWSIKVFYVYVYCEGTVCMFSDVKVCRDLQLFVIVYST
jgi:hypothetical protein